MIRKILFTLVLFYFPLSLFAHSITTIEGKALHYAGEKLTVYKIEDYLSDVTKKIATTEIEPSDSSFKLSFYNDETRQLKIKIGKDYLTIYTQPGATYNLYIDGKNPYPSDDAPGVDLQYMFLDLDTTDINYKTLHFDNEKMDFLDKYYNYRGTHTVEFAKKLDSFKLSVHTFYEKDTSDFFKVFVKYSFASLDDLTFLGNRGSYEKYDFYIRPSTVWYANDRYMDYILHFFDKHADNLPDSTSDKFYQGILHSSPTLIMRSLDDDYTLQNLRLREVIMIKMLSQVYYDNDFPKTNILSVLDSVSQHALFSADEIIAKNIKFRLLHLAEGAIMPDFGVRINGKMKYASDYKGHHVYIQFIDKNDLSMSDAKLLPRLYNKYGQYVHFLTILVVDGDTSKVNTARFKEQHQITWDFAKVKKGSALLKKLNVVTYPYYILMDATAHVVAAPALTPRPNGEYHTIEESLYEISRAYKSMQDHENRR